MARAFQRVLGGIESPGYKTESGFIPTGDTSVPAGICVMYKDSSPITDLDGPAPIVISDGTACIGLLNQDVTPSRDASTLGYVVGAKVTQNRRELLTHESEEGAECAVLLGPAVVAVSSDVYVGTPVMSAILYVSDDGKLTATQGTPSDTAGNLPVAVCESGPSSDGNMRAILLGPYSTYFAYLSGPG